MTYEKGKIMKISKYCEICHNPKCPHEKDKIHDMQDLIPACYVAFKMVNYENTFVPNDLCNVNRYNEIDDCLPCNNACSGENCDTCIVTKIFNDYARITGQNKKTEEKIKGFVLDISDIKYTTTNILQALENTPETKEWVRDAFNPYVIQTDLLANRIEHGVAGIIVCKVAEELKDIIKSATFTTSDKNTILLYEEDAENLSFLQAEKLFNCLIDTVNAISIDKKYNLANIKRL